jgi:hypothetical protein
MFIHVHSKLIKAKLNHFMLLTLHRQAESISGQKLTFLIIYVHQNFYVSGGFAGKRPEKPTLILTHPNGGELFVAGNDTVITWEGIPNTDTVKLEYSHDNGQSWLTVSEQAVGGKHDWLRIPRTPSTECLMKVSQLNMDAESNP